MSREGRIPVIIVGGFLGAGKTTLVNSLIGQGDGRRIAALVNDFGALNIDADLVVGVDGNTIALANGCICCTIRGDLARACANLVRRSQKPDIVIVELSGVSEPGPVLSTFLETELRLFFELSGVVTVVDALTWGQHSGEPEDLQRSQLRSADIIALSKTDIADTVLTSKVLRDLHEAAPGIPVFPAPRGKFPLAMLLHELQPGKRTAPFRVTSAGHGLSTWTWRERLPLSLPKLEHVITGLPKEVFRCKGYVGLEEFPQVRFLVQAVGQRCEFSPVSHWPNANRESKLNIVYASEAFSDSELKTRFESTIGTYDLTASPVLRLVHKLVPELLEVDTV